MKLKKLQPAFTLIDTLFSLVLTLVLFSFLGLFISYVQQLNAHIYDARQQQWETFLMFVEKNTQNCQNVEIIGSRFLCEASVLPESTVMRKVELKKGTRDWINLSVNGGTMIVLNNVSKMNYELLEDTVTVRATFTDGEVYSDRIKLARIKRG